MNSETKEKSDYDTSLGLVVADTWGQLGRYLSAFHPEERPDAKRAAAERWIRDLLGDDLDEWRDDALAALTPERLIDFAENAYRLLDRKYRGESIAAEALERMRGSEKLDARDDGQFLELTETPDVWWANEYRYLLLDIGGRAGRPNWLNVAATCAYDKCGRFFIKQRSDQRFHSEACRAKSANQRSYQKRKARPHKRA